MQVPAELLQLCPEPNLVGIETTGDLEQAAIEALAAARCGNDDKTKIKEWLSE